MKKTKLKLIPVSLLLGLLSLILVFTALALNTDQEEPDLSIVGTNLSFSESVYIKYAVAYDGLDEYEDIKLLIWNNPQTDYTIGTENSVLESVGTGTVADKECLIFNYTELAAKQMTDSVYARAVYQKNGETYYSDVKKYSVLNYVYNKLGYTGTATENEQLASLLQGLIEYGASAQNYFGYKTDALATDKHVEISVENGYFSDGCSSALVTPGTVLEVTAPTVTENGNFACWINENGDILSTSSTYTITAGNNNYSLSAVYATFEGGEVDGAGSTLADDSFAMTEHIVDMSNVTNVTSSNLQNLVNTNRLEKGKVYRITNAGSITVSSSFNGNGAVLIAPAGINIVSANDISISNAILLAPVTVTNSSNVTLSNVDIQTEGNSLSIDSSSSNITVDNCRLTASGTALSTNAANTTVKNSYIEGETSVVFESSGNTLFNSHVLSTSIAVSASGTDNAINNNTIISFPFGEGIVIAPNSINTLVSFNSIDGTQVSVNVENATNTVVLFNSVYDIAASNNVNLYAVKNGIGGKLELRNNNYLICDANTYADNGKDHTVVSVGNDNMNGDSLMDVTARNEVGAKEELLPHTNKDLFLDMERKTTVKDVANGTAYDLTAYIETNAKANGIVIVPPGAYSTAKGDAIILTEAMSNTEIYAYGVYNDHEFRTNEEYLADTKKGTNMLIQVLGSDNLTIYGMTNAYNYQSLGQAHILKKMSDNQLLVVPSAGFDLDLGWGKSNPGVFRGSFYACHKGDPTPWFESSFEHVTTNEDKTLVIKVTEDIYNKLGVGDILCTRMAGDNQASISVVNAENILFKDCVLHGYAAALAHMVSGRSYNVKLERVHNCPTSPYVMSAEDYKYFTDLETAYPGVDFEMYVDDSGRYRGTQPRFCSVDATHIISGQGLDIESCLFEQMCDDGSNQHGTSYRLHSIKDNGNGTATVYIKGNVTQVHHGHYSDSDNHERNMTPDSYFAGDNIFIYTPGGEIVCDAICLTGEKSEPQLVELYKLGVMTYFIHVKSVTVPIESVNFDALEGYDLKDNHYRMDNKITVDNISLVSGNFTIDNYMIRNSWSRGVLTKTVNATIKNSTFQHIKSAGILAHCEPEWGESTIPRNILVENCLFNETGYAGESWDLPKNSPVYITGLSTYGEANINKIVANNITIKGCEIKNYGHQYGVCIDGAQNINIIDNIFDPLDASDPGNFVKITTAVNVNISGNKYRDSEGNLSTISGIDADDYAGIRGSDVEGLFKADCDIFVAGEHLSSFKIVPADKQNLSLAKILSTQLKDVCGYSVAATTMPYSKEVKLVVNDAVSDLIKSNAYTVACIDGQLVITAESNAAMIYAIEDFVAYIAQLNQTQQSIYFDEGYSESFEFSINNIIATNQNLFKYTGIWNQSGDAMVSGADADYVEFNFTGHTFTLVFDGETTFKISIDGAEPTEYTVSGEKTFTLTEGEHSVRVLCTDTSKPVKLVSVKTFSSQLSKANDKTKYVQFIGDSMVDYDDSFAHRIGDILGWDYSVVVGDTLPTTSVTRAPDVFVLFLGTDAITSSSTADEIKAFKTTYKNLITSITSKYSSAKVFIMQPLSTSNASDMFNTSHNRYAAINAMKDASLTGIFDNDNIQIVENTNKLIDWNIEFDTTVSTTYPTKAGDYTVTVKLANYLLKNAGDSNYINATFPHSGMKIYNNSADSSVTQMSEDGISFVRYHFAVGGHAWISGNDFANVSVSNSGRYLVLKYRASGEDDLTLELRTNDYGTDQGEYGKGHISKVTKTENNVPEDWEVAVVDLQQYEHYTVNLSNTKVQLRISTGSDTLDIAYAAIVDTISEAKMVTMFELGDVGYRFYEDWSKVGTDVYLNGEEPEPEIDLSFVNQEFTFLSLKKWNGSTVSPDQLVVNSEEGVDFARFNFTSHGHVFLTGVNNFVELTGDTGRYFVIKYRSTNNTYISFNVLTSDYEWDNQGNNTATKSKPAANINAGQWETAVIDLSVFVNTTKDTKYTTDADLDVWLRFTTGVSEIDISYMAIVDDLNEASTFIKYKGDTSYVHYEDWSKTGTSVTID